MAGKLIASLLSNGVTEKDLGAVLLDPSSVQLSGSGYQKLPSGLIIQWGTTLNLSTTPLATNFATTFPTACVGVLLTINSTGTPNESALTVTAKTKTNFTAVGKIYGGTSLNLPVFYVALGY